jgi:hypothetical protein
MSARTRWSRPGNEPVDWRCEVRISYLPEGRAEFPHALQFGQAGVPLGRIHFTTRTTAPMTTASVTEVTTMS